jgi:TATA-box binding protein (TBP) (component of TFIID and TFIIIB)
MISFAEKECSLHSVDDEWSSFLVQQNLNDDNYSVHKNKYNSMNTESVKIIDEINKKNNENNDKMNSELIETNEKNIVKMISPICDDLYISTKTKVLFFNLPIDIHSIFWNIHIIEYWQPVEGVVKKQIKVVSKTPDEYETYKEKLRNVRYYTETIIKQIDNPESRRIKFKDERKISIGISKKDIVNYRGKVKNAFYNCFALIFRIKYQGEFREIHVKIFNTGKLEIPGILNNEILDIIKNNILTTIQPFVSEKLEFIEQFTNDNVLINSNFNCNFNINREKLHNILRSDKYRIESSYDPCSYPGVKCKFYFNNSIGFDCDLQKGQILEKDRGMKMSELKENNKYTEISFMVFRTGSCLIVGNCSEEILNFVFEFLKKILKEEYNKIYVENNDTFVKIKNTKQIKKSIIVSNDYYIENISKNIKCC